MPVIQLEVASEPEPGPEPEPQAERLGLGLGGSGSGSLAGESERSLARRDAAPSHCQSEW